MVFVDDAKHRYGRMTMCHMVADSHDELLEMATAIGVAHRWIQQAGTVYEHFDICLASRAKAVERGAVEVTQRELVSKIRRKRASGVVG